MTIQAVFFDMGGTIETFWHDRQMRLEATPGIQRRLKAAGIDLHLGNERLYQVVSDRLERYHKWSVQTLEELSPHQVWKEFVLPDFPVDISGLEAIAEDLAQYVETHFYHREMRPEMPAVLEAISSWGLTIGLISNVCSRGQIPASLDRNHIRRYFGPIVLSSVYGRRKPDPTIFHHAARLANAPTSRCIHVGDRISRDIWGARRAGYRLAVQIRHDVDHDENDHGPRPDAVINRMTELLDILQAELSRSDRNRPNVDVSEGRVRAILFDAGDVLYYRSDPGRRLAAFIEELGIQPGDVSEAAQTALKRQAFQGLISRDEYRERVLRLHGITRVEHIERGKRIMDEEDNAVFFFEGTAETLASLKQKGYLMGVVTNTAVPVHVKLRWFEDGGFGDVWESIISSQDLGIQKPAPEIYAAALKQLGLPGDQVAFVGHDADELDGARTVGMKTIAFNCGKKAKADFYIEEFSDLLVVPVISQSSPQDQANERS